VIKHDLCRRPHARMLVQRMTAAKCGRCNAIRKRPRVVDLTRGLFDCASAIYCTALIMSKIGRYIATTMPPTITPRNTIITGSIRLRRPLTAVSTSVS